MIKFKGKVKTKSFIKGLEQLNASYPNVAKAIVKELAGEAVALGKTKFAPVLSGNLRSTLRVIERDNKIFFVAGGIEGSGKQSKFVDYAEYVNNGTSRQRPQFFMEKSTAGALFKKDSLSKQILASWIKQINK